MDKQPTQQKQVAQQKQAVAPAPALKKVTAEPDLILKEAQAEDEAEKTEKTEKTLLGRAQAQKQRVYDGAMMRKTKLCEGALMRKQQLHDGTVSLKNGTVSLVKDPKFQTITISSAAGSITLGTAGGAFGVASGICAGGALGVVPALLTFGLSIPAGAAMGGGAGLCLGSASGAVVGAAGGAATGCGVYRYRVQIHDGFITVRTKAENTTAKARMGVKDVVECTQVKIYSTKTQLHTKACAVYGAAKKRTSPALLAVKAKAQSIHAGAQSITAGACETIATKEFKVTATSASGGAVVGGAAGGVAGGAAGTLAGAAVGLGGALFTFGLSIPVCALVGGGLGVCAGTVSGGGAGAVTAGAVGYSSFKHRKEIGDGTNRAWTKVKDSADKIRHLGHTGGSA